MARERSPNYPQVALDEAVKNIQALFKRESKTAVPPEIAVRAWGYTSLNGAARRRIAALRQYRLLESDKAGNVRVSRLGLTVVMRTSDSPEYAAAIREAALAPAIFRELNETRVGASDDALQHFLVAERKFSPDGARHVIEAYKATVGFAKLSDSSYTDITEEESDVDQTSHKDGLDGRRNAADDNRGGDKGIIEHYRYPLSGGVTAELTFRGSKVTRRELQLLQRYLALAELALDEDTDIVAQEPDPSNVGSSRG